MSKVGGITCQLLKGTEKNLMYYQLNITEDMVGEENQWGHIFLDNIQILAPKYDDIIQIKPLLALYCIIII